MEASSLLRDVVKSWILLLVVAGSFAFSPILLLAHYSPTVGRLWYWAMFSFVEQFWLKKNDHAVRIKLLEPMAEECKKREARGANLKVLEIGPGTGGNFGYYPSGLLLTTLELNPWLQMNVESVKQKHVNLKIEQMLTGSAEDMSMIADESFDAVVGTHILCCIRDKEAAVREIHRVLKKVKCCPDFQARRQYMHMCDTRHSFLSLSTSPSVCVMKGGRYFSSEIVACSDKERGKRLIQRLMAPFWYFFTLGCSGGNFDPLVLLSRTGFDVAHMEELDSEEGPPTHSRNLYGGAIKKPS